MTDEFSILDYLGNVAPVVLVMGVVLYVLWREYKAEKDKNEKHVNDLLETTKDQIKMNEEIKAILNLLKDK